MDHSVEANKAKSIEISPFWEAELKALPFLSQKSGKTIHLLKSGSKKIQTGKKRKKIPILGTIKHYKESKKIVTDVQQQPQPATVVDLGAATEDLMKKREAKEKKPQ